jgi:hypothetical protein
MYQYLDLAILQLGTELCLNKNGKGKAVYTYMVVDQRETLMNML